MLVSGSGFHLLETLNIQGPFFIKQPSVSLTGPMAPVLVPSTRDVSTKEPWRRDSIPNCPCLGFGLVDGISETNDTPRNLTWLVVEPTHLKNMLVKMGIFPK